MSVTKNIKVVMFFLFCLLAISEEVFVLIALEFFALHVGNPTGFAPLMCKVHAEIGMQAGEHPLEEPVVKQAALEDLVESIAWTKTIAVANEELVRADL